MLRSTESRPVADYSGIKRGELVGFPASGETITSSTWRRIPVATARIIRAGSASNPQSYKWGRRRRGWFDPVSRVETMGYKLLD